MRKFWCVTTSFDNRGNVTSGITDCIEADEMPKGVFMSTKQKDIYSDWFDSLEEAQEFVEEARQV